MGFWRNKKKEPDLSIRRLQKNTRFFYYSTFDPMRDRICQPSNRVLKQTIVYPQCCSFVVATVAEH